MKIGFARHQGSLRYPRAENRIVRYVNGLQESSAHLIIEDLHIGHTAINQMCEEIEHDPTRIGRAFVNTLI